MSDDTEHWLPVVGYEGYYEVSDLGRVRSVDRWIERRGRAAGPRFLRGKVLKPKSQPDGRLIVDLYRHSRGATRRISVLVLESFTGPRPPRAQGCHNNGDPTDNRLDNLRWDTPSENAYDAVRHGRSSQRNKTHCPSGHLLALPNLRAAVLRHGHRSCLACAKARKQKGRDFQAAADAEYGRIMGRHVA